MIVNKPLMAPLAPSSDEVSLGPSKVGKMPEETPFASQGGELPDGGEVTGATSIDMRSIAVNGLNDLIRSGQIGFGMTTVPFVPPHLIAQYGVEHAMDLEVNYLGQVETSIDFKRSLGEPTEYLEKLLTKLKALHEERSLTKAYV